MSSNIRKIKIQDSKLITQSTPKSLDETNRTVELVFTTGFKGIRNSFSGPYYEELSLDPNHVDLSRLQNGAPLLNNHDSSSLNSVIGVVERAWIDGELGKAEVRFSSTPETDLIYQKVKENIIRNVSIGYTVKQYEDVTPDNSSTPTYRATNWQPFEISLVPIGFDPYAQTRNQNLNPTEVEIFKKGKSMDKNNHEEIRSLVKTAKLETTFAEELIKDNVSSDEARKRIFEKMAQANQTVVNTNFKVEVGTEDIDHKRNAVEDILLNRLDPENFKVSERSRNLFDKGLIEQVETYIPRKLMESKISYAQRAMSKSDLPLLLANVAEKALQKNYILQEKTHTAWTKDVSLKDYKEFSQIRLSEFPSLEEKLEGAEYKFGSISEENEVVQLKDYGKIISFSSQMIVNDDLSGLKKYVIGSAQAASRLDNKLAYNALLTNYTMKDGYDLYSSQHNNLGTSGAINETTLNEAFKAIMKQTNVGGLDKLNLVPKFLIVGPDKRLEAQKMLAQIQPSQSSNVNPFSGKLELIIDAEIEGNQFYLACDPNSVDTVVMYRLLGQESPQLESKIDFNTDALLLKLKYTVVPKAMDYRGLFKNPGN